MNIADIFRENGKIICEDGRELPVLTMDPALEADLVPAIRTDKLGAALFGMPLDAQISYFAITEAKMESTQNGNSASLEDAAWNWPYATPVTRAEGVEAVLATEGELLLGIVLRGMPIFLGRSAGYTVTRYSGDENNGAGYKEGHDYEDTVYTTLLYNPYLLDKTLFCYDEAYASQSEIVISEDFEKIGHAAFRGCKKLKRVVLPSTLTEIGHFAFYGCEALEEIVIPESGLRIIGNGAFEKCLSLREISLPDTLTSLGSATFKECKKLTRVKLPTAFPYIPNELFRECISLSEVTLPQGVETVFGEAFRSCVSLTHIELPAGTKRLADGVFRGCYRLKEITLPKTVTDFGRRVFDGCAEELKIKKI